MFQTLRNAWKIVDLRKKILYTLFIILIFRIGSIIPVPFVELEALGQADSNEYMQLLTIMSGGGFSNASIFALSITPYINASIIMQLLSVAFPFLERLSQEGEAGRKKIATYTRYVTVGLGLLLGTAYYFMVRNNYQAIVDEAMSGAVAWFAGAVIVLCFSAGSTLVMWLGEQINENGIGNGISVLLFAGILSRLPEIARTLVDMIVQGVQNISNGGLKYVILAPVIVVLFIVIIAFIVFMTDAERRIPVQYAKRVVGRKMYGGQSTYIPIKVNMSGVMPIILASSIVSLPSIIASFIWGSNGTPTGWWAPFFNAFRGSSPIYLFVLFLLIIGFAFFYVTIQYNPVEMANNLRKNSGAIPGYRPGKPTSDYIKRVLSKVTLMGALFCGVIAVLPGLFGIVMPELSGLALGGTSIMIVVGVALETVQQIESQMMMRHYKGFLE